MNIKIIKLPKNAKPKKAEQFFNEVGYNCIKFSVDRRTHAKQKVVKVIREHKKYSETLKDTLLFEGIISILNRKDFWMGSPDFLIWNYEELYFCEFKSQNDVFRLNQLEWFEKFDVLPTAIAFAVLPIKDFKKQPKKGESKGI